MFNLASKYYFIFSDFRIRLLLMLIEEYVNGAALQINRIERTRKLVQKKLHSNRNKKDFYFTSCHKHHLKLFCDAHFYFICIGQVNKCFKRLLSILKDNKLKKIYSEFQKTFSQEIRNDLEHIDARAIGLKKKGRKEISIGHIKDFKNFSNDNLTFNGKSYPVNKDSLNKLKKIYKNIISAIHDDYALKDPFFVDSMIRRKQVEEVIKIAQIEYQKYLHS